MKALFNTKVVPWIITIVLVTILLIYLLTSRFSGNTDEDNKLELNNFVLEMKDQVILLDSTLRKKNQSSLLKLNEVEIEAHFVIKNKSSKSGENRYEILTIDNQENYKSEQIQKITLHLGRNARRGQ